MNISGIRADANKPDLIISRLFISCLPGGIGNFSRFSNTSFCLSQDFPITYQISARFLSLSLTCPQIRLRFRCCSFLVSLHDHHVIDHPKLRFKLFGEQFERFAYFFHNRISNDRTFKTILRKQKINTSVEYYWPTRH